MHKNVIPDELWYLKWSVVNANNSDKTQWKLVTEDMPQRIINHGEFLHAAAVHVGRRVSQ